MLSPRCRICNNKNSGSLTLVLIYAGMMELADMRDLGAVTSVKVFGRRTPAGDFGSVDMW